MLNNLLSTFLGGFLYTLMFFVISFVTVLFFRLCAYYFKTNAPKRPEKKRGGTQSRTRTRAGKGRPAPPAPQSTYH